MSCPWTIAASTAGEQRHKALGEKTCEDCRQARNEYNRAGYRIEAKRWAIVWALYRLRRHEYEAILELQGGVCAICKGPFGQGYPHTDHDHNCDHPDKGMKSCASCVRGILCNRCNPALAILEDKDWLKKALDYLADDSTAEIVRQSRLW